MRNPVQKNFQRACIHSKRIWLWFIAAGVLGFCFLAACLAIVPAINPAFGAETADRLRTLVGPQPVALLESISFKLQDQLNQFRSTINGGKTQITFSQPAEQIPSSSSDGSPVSTPTATTPQPTPISGSRSTQHTNTDSSCRGRLASDRLAGLRSECERRACHGACVDFG